MWVYKNFQPLIYGTETFYKINSNIWDFSGILTLDARIYMYFLPLKLKRPSSTYFLHTTLGFPISTDDQWNASATFFLEKEAISFKNVINKKYIIKSELKRKLIIKAELSGKLKGPSDLKL